MTLPSGVSGLKKPAGLPSDDTSSRLRIAWPASRTPAFSPTRGSGLPVVAPRDCAPIMAIPHDRNAAAVSPYFSPCSLIS